MPKVFKRGNTGEKRRGMGSLTENIRRYFAFSGEEIRAMMIGVLTMAFVFSFNDWGKGAFDIAIGLRNFINAAIVSTLAIVAHHGVQRIMGLYVGFKAEWRLWTYGIIASLLIAFLSKGKLIFFAPGGMIAYHMAGHRLGAFRYGLNYWALSLCALSGSLMNMTLAIFFKLMQGILPNNSLINTAIIINLLLAVFTMLPIPPLNGGHLFFISRLTYAFSFTGIVAMAVLLYFFNVWIALLVGILIGAICWQAYIWIFEV
ncbi:MAG TPA: hypothetical protein VJK52_03030 [Candidatus Nanoarchaeia archaeon]|nr:hypothetical protein [Candidatus Nanoarchaeia archaeon]